MRVILNTKDKTRALVLAETETDKESLRVFYDNHVLFGLYQIWLRTPEGKGENRPEIKQYLDQIPTLTGIGWLNLVKGFVPTRVITT